MKARLTFVVLFITLCLCMAWVPLQSEINKDMSAQPDGIPTVVSSQKTTGQALSTPLPQKGLNFQVYQNLTVPGGVGQLWIDKNLGVVFTFPVPAGVRNRKLYTYQCGFFAYGFSIIHFQKQGQDILRLPLAIEDPGIAAGGVGVSENYALSANSLEFQSQLVAPSVCSQSPGCSASSLQKFTAGTGAGDPSAITTIYTANPDTLVIKAPTGAGATPLYQTGQGTTVVNQFFSMSLLPFLLRDLDIDSVSLEIVSAYSLHSPPNQPNIQMFIGVYTE